MHGADDDEQTLALGPAASQIAIKQLGTNGGGFFNANSAHPFENPTPLSNFLEMLAILLIPAALCYTFGSMVRRPPAGLGGARRDDGRSSSRCAGRCCRRRAAGNPALGALGVDQAGQRLAAGGNMEGKEVRFGIADSALWAAATTAASNGSVNAMHDSYTPLGGLVPMWLMQLGEVVFGGVGSGLYGMLVFAIVAVFIAGLMVGRTPEYLGKKIEAFEMKMASLVILASAAAGAGRHRGRRAGRQPARRASPTPAPHGFSEILYAFSSAGNNNGSAFAGLSAQHALLQHDAGARDAVGRYWLIVPVLAIAGSLARKKRVAADRRHAADRTPAVRRAADRRRADRRRADLLPGAGARADRRAPACCSPQ